MNDLTKEPRMIRASVDTVNRLTVLKNERNEGKSPTDPNYLKSLDQMIRRDYFFDHIGEIEEQQDITISNQKESAIASSGV